MYKCFAYMYECVLHGWPVPKDPEEVRSLELELKKVVSFHVSARN